MKEQDIIHPVLPKRPATNDPLAWRIYWQASGQPWRTEAEIPLDRQEFLTRCRAIVPDVERGIYPFKEVKLKRADVEWLLASHENGRGPVEWSDASQRTREGLDLRGADLFQAVLDGLPLACLHGGLNWKEKLGTNKQQREAAAIKLEQAQLRYAHLEGACLREARLCGADLEYAHLEGASLRDARVGGANLQNAFLDSATDLKRLYLGDKHVGFLSLAGIHLADVDLTTISWSTVELLGDEQLAKQERDRDKRLRKYRYAIQAYQQLAHALKIQGHIEDSDRFAFRAHKLQLQVLLWQQKYGTWLFFWLLALLTGNGFKPARVLYWYVGVVLGCMLLFILVSHLAWYDALLLSLRDFHGRGFFAEQTSEGGLQAVIGAVEAFMGLFIEASLIAAFTQRLFGR